MSFDLDPCAASNRPWPTAKNHYTIEDDGLSKKWFGRVWSNPPYSDARVWIEKLQEHGNGIALIFARTDTQLFHGSVFPKASGVLFIEGRLNFYYETGFKSKNGAGAPSVLIAFGDNNKQVLKKSKLRGYFIDLRQEKAPEVQ